MCRTRVLFGRLFIATPSSISSATASSVWRNLNGTRRNFVREKERSLCQGRKGPHAERERVGHRFPTFLKKASIATCFPLPTLTSRFPKSVKKSVKKSRAEEQFAKCTSDVVGNACARIAYNSFVLRPSIQAVRARVRA